MNPPMLFLLFADGNCIHMVDTGIVQKLLELLDRHVEEGNVTVQHAALSALRNLAIPGGSMYQTRLQVTPVYSDMLRLGTL